MESHESRESWFEPLWSEGIVTELIAPLRSGKEAAVFLCRGGASTGRALVAAKVYRPRENRTFRNDAVYKAGRVVVGRRLRLAVEKKSRFGRRVDASLWVDREAEVLADLGRAGADVPRVFAARPGVVVMEYFGDEEAPAPQLKDVRPDARQAREWLDRLLWNVELMLSRHVVHADLSPFNVLIWEGRPRVIDFPQAVDARTNPNARDLLRRDVANLCRHFARFGVERNADGWAETLWRRHRVGEL